MKKRKIYSFSGPHKVRFGTPNLGHNRFNRLQPSKYERISRYKEYVSLNSVSDVVVVHYSFWQKLWLVIKFIFKF